MGDISKAFTIDNMKKLDYMDACMIFKLINVDDISDIHKYLIKSMICNNS